MKKLLTTLLGLALSVTMMACSVQEAKPTESKAKPAESQSEPVATNETPASADKPTAAATKDVSGVLTASGSTSVQPLFEKLGEAFSVKYPAASVEVQGGGSSTGYKNVVAKVSEVGNLSRELKDEEKANVTRHVIAIDGIAVVMHKDNSVKNLTKDDVIRIFCGEVNNWKDLGGEDMEISVISREAGSGTRSAFEEILGIEDKVVATQELNETGLVKSTVASNPNAIGYISLGSLDDSVQAASLDGVAPSHDTILDGSYILQRPFLSCNVGEVSPLFQAFLDFIQSPEGEKVITENGYFPVKHA